MCPGRLARDLGTTLGFIRPLLEQMHQKGLIEVFQRGRPAILKGLRGPFRVAPTQGQWDDQLHERHTPRTNTIPLPSRTIAGCGAVPSSPWPTTLFDAWIGVDFSGAGAPNRPAEGLRVFRGAPGAPIIEVAGPLPGGLWSREALALWLLEEIQKDQPLLIGLDHAFGFPQQWCLEHGASDWPQVLELAETLWPARQHSLSQLLKSRPLPAVEKGYRLCDRWSHTAKSVFHTGSGGVAHSTLAGLPWLRFLRNHARGKLHFWPFDGWQPQAGHSVIAEVYPSLWRRRFCPQHPGFNEHQADAWRVAAWMQWADEGGTLSAFWRPPLRPEEAAQARLEGWILGVM